MGANQSKKEIPKEEFDLDSGSNDKTKLKTQIGSGINKTIDIDELSKYRSGRRYWTGYLNTISIRIPYVIEDYFGKNMRLECAMKVPETLMTFHERKLVKENNVSEIKRMIFKNLLPIDDPIDLYSQHTLLHDAVIMNRVDLFEFLVS